MSPVIDLRLPTKLPEPLASPSWESLSNYYFIRGILFASAPRSKEPQLDPAVTTDYFVKPNLGCNLLPAVTVLINPPGNTFSLNKVSAVITNGKARFRLQSPEA